MERNGKQRPLKRKILIIAGLLMGGGLLVYYAAVIDWALFFSALQHLHPSLLLGAFIFLLGSSLARALRFEALSRHAISPATFPIFYRLKESWLALCVGCMGNMLYPARAGEVLRIYEARRRLGLSWAGAIATGGLDRLLDVAGVVFLGWILVYTVFSTNEAISRMLSILALVLALFVMFFFIAFWQHEKMLRAIRYLLRPVPATWSVEAENFLQQIRAFLFPLRSPGILARVLLYNVLVMVSDCFFCFFLLKAFGWELPLYAGVLMQVCISLAGALPSAPGYVGLYQAAAVLVLSQFGFTETHGVVFATTLQAVQLLFFLCSGGRRMLSLQKDVPARNREYSG